VNVLFLSLDLSNGMTFLVYYILLLLRTPSNGSLRPICFIRSSLQYDFILVYYEVTVLLRRWTFIVIGALQVFTVLCCIVSSQLSETQLFEISAFTSNEMCIEISVKSVIKHRIWKCVHRSSKHITSSLEVIDQPHYTLCNRNFLTLQIKGKKSSWRFHFGVVRKPILFLLIAIYWSPFNISVHFCETFSAMISWFVRKSTEHSVKHWRGHLVAKNICKWYVTSQNF